MSQETPGRKNPKKPAVFFQTEENESASRLRQSTPVRPGSLTDIIARHLEQPQSVQTGEDSGEHYNKRQKSVDGAPESARAFFGDGTDALYLYEKTYVPENRHAGSGIHINQLDGQMPSGVEHLLPNARTRYGVMKRRLESEIASLKASLRDYQALIASTSSGNRPKLADEARSLQARLFVLERRYAKANFALEGIERQANPFKHQVLDLWRQISERMADTLAAQSASGFKKPLSLNFVGQPFGLLFGRGEQSIRQESLAKAYAQLRDAQVLLEAELARPTPHSETLSALVFQYERLLGQYQRLLGQGKKPVRG